jgi:hypothetical protein
MSDLLVYATTEMHRLGMDISILWGDRYRYGNYGWEYCGDSVEWTLDTRHTSPNNLPPVKIRPYRHATDFKRVVQAWNSDPIGTYQPADRLEQLLKRPGWKTVVTEAGPFAFATYLLNSEKTYLRVDKIVGPEPLRKALLLRLAQAHRQPQPRIAVVSPPGDHPLRELAAARATGWTRGFLGGIKTITLRSTLTNLLPLLNARHVPQPPLDISLRMEPDGQMVTLRLGREVSLSVKPARTVLRLSQCEMARLLFGSPFDKLLTGPVQPLNNLFPAPLHIERIAYV